MLGRLFDTILYPVVELLKLLDDQRITDYLGVSLISCIVTCMIMLIVIKALVNPSAIGSMAVERENIKTAKANKVAAQEARKVNETRLKRLESFDRRKK